MLESGKISIRQFMILVCLFTVGSSILIMPPGLTIIAKQDSWMAAIIGMGVGLLLVWLYAYLGSLFPSQTIVEYSEMILGKWLGKIISVLFFSYAFLLSALVLRNIGDFLTTQIMPETPIEFIHVAFLVAVIIGVQLGLEPLARTGELFFSLTIFLFLILVLFTFPEVEADNMKPVLEKGIKPIVLGAFSFLGTPFLELIVFLMILPYINEPKKAGKAFFIGTFYGGVILIVIISLTLLVIGTDLTARHIYPSYALAQKISIGNFLERIEVIMAMIWFTTIFFKLTVCYYASALSLAQILNLTQYRSLLIPLGMIMVVLSLVAYPDIIYFRNIIGRIWAPYAMTFGLIIPVLLLAVAVFRKIRIRT